MAAREKKYNILVASGDEKLRDFLAQILPSGEYEIAPVVRSAGEARRKFISNQYNILIINTPLPDETGIELAQDLSERPVGILVLTDIHSFDQTAHELEDLGVLTASKPFGRQQAYAYVKLLTAFSNRLSKMEKANKTLQEKVMDIRVINRAKWVLIANEGLTEEEAHHRIEQIAMENRESARMAAEDIIKKYEE
jgi:response regulator NasT